MGDYAAAAWMFVATCDTCCRQARVDPAEVLTHPRTHPRMRLAELAIHLRCRDCCHRPARIDPVAPPAQAAVCYRDDLTGLRGTPPAGTTRARLMGPSRAVTRPGGAEAVANRQRARGGHSPSPLGSPAPGGG